MGLAAAKIAVLALRVAYKPVSISDGMHLKKDLERRSTCALTPEHGDMSTKIGSFMHHQHKDSHDCRQTSTW